MAAIDDLFQAALGLAEPWQVVRTEFDAQARRLDLHLDFGKGARFPCPDGDQPACPVHDTQLKTWRHLDGTVASGRKAAPASTGVETGPT
jgi:transposase